MSPETKLAYEPDQTDTTSGISGMDLPNTAFFLA